VEQVGDDVKVAAVGDPVLLSFASCQACRLCQQGHASHCVDAGKLNFLGNKTFQSITDEERESDILGCFFGQSSFSSLSIVHESSVVNVKGLVESDEELRLFAPLGCGIQTGSGTILNVAQAMPEDTVAIIGAGGVGLSATMAAKIAGCQTIVVIDRVQPRLDLAKELGATHTINTLSFTDLQQLIDEVRSFTGGYGTSITMDATGVLPLIKSGLEFTARRGQYIQVGSSKPESVLDIPLQDFMVSGKRIIGAVEGQVIPQEYIPKMIQWSREGKFPFDKFTKQYPAEQFEHAIAGMVKGAVIKPIIQW
jgi:Zn-dependent alcohol dehydrogenase